MKEEKHSKKPIGKIVGFSILGIIGAWLLLTVVVPLAMGDGLGNYSGAKRELAESAIDNKWTQIENLSRWAYVIHVDDVRPTTSDEVSKYCIARQPNQAMVISNDTNDPRSYTAILTVHNLATFSSKTFYYDGCQLLSTRFGDGSR